MSEEKIYRIRPAGRHILTIGRELIQDSYAAVVELVKNAYDADSDSVDINFYAKEDKSGYQITIKDYGHGMSRDTVINKWMVPSTRDKLDRKISPGGRVMQGRKGIGRYAASVLGSDILLETINELREKTTVFVEWSSFESAKYLDDVEILVESQLCNDREGTMLTITGGKDYLEEWDKTQFNNLRFELKKLISKSSRISNEEKSEFKINLKISNFSGFDDIDELIEPYPIFDLYDYRISGMINSNGSGYLIYAQQKSKNSVEETVVVNLKKPTSCGDLEFDIRVYDRDPDAIESLIARGLKDDEGNYVGKLQARQLLNELNGVGVYRNGFRIRPLGDADFDWLKLNEQRVQNPSMRIGSNQVIGYVHIQSEEQSDLVEKSARDGLRENAAYEQLKIITKYVLGKLEERRFSYRRKTGLSEPTLKVERELEKLFSFESLKKDIRNKLISDGMAESAANEVLDLIAKEEDQKTKVVGNIRQIVASYQGQATLGKIINVVLHEGRRSLNYFKNDVPRIARFHNKLAETRDHKYIDEIITIAKGVEINSAFLSDLFKRLDPLATGKRSIKKPLAIKQEILNAFAIFRQEMYDNHIVFEVNGDDTLTYPSWSQDIHAIFVNLIDNSVFWMKEKSSVRRITVDIISDSVLSYIDFRDTGPGIESSLIKDGVIFEPQFSTKPSGTGIGLAIAGEASERNNFQLKALDSSSGAYFRLQVKEISND